MGPIRAWRTWTTPTATGELARRREAVLLRTLAAAVVLSMATQIIQLVGLATRPALSWLLWWALNLLAGCFFAVLLRRARRGRQRQSAALLIGTLCTLAIALQLATDITNPMCPLLLALSLLLAAMLLDGSAAAVVLAAIASIVLPIIALQHAHVLPVNAPGSGTFTDGISFFAVLAFMAGICRLYGRDVLTNIDEALTRSSPDSPLRQLRTKTLTMREIEVVQLVADGLSNETIAGQLFLSPRTVQSHIANAMKKTECANRTELGVLAVREGLVPLRHEHSALADPTKIPTTA